jgi:hypothetical protein
MGDKRVLTEIAGMMNTTPDAAPELLLGMLSALDMLPEALPDAATLDTLAASVNTERLGNHPEPLTAAELRDIYVQALSPMAAAEKERLAALWRKYAV